MAGNLSSDDDLISGINVTPLVDVVLVLLIIFMITAPFIYQSAIKVNLPDAKTGEQTDKTKFDFTLAKDGSVTWGEERLEWPALEVKLKAEPSPLKDQTATINADRETPHGQVIKLMDLLRQFGLTRFGMNVNSPQ